MKARKEGWALQINKQIEQGANSVQLKSSVSPQMAEEGKEPQNGLLSELVVGSVIASDNFLNTVLQFGIGDRGNCYFCSNAESNPCAQPD